MEHFSWCSVAQSYTWIAWSYICTIYWVFLWKVNSINFGSENQSSFSSLFVPWEKFQSNLCRHSTPIMENTLLRVETNVTLKICSGNLYWKTSWNFVWVLWMHWRIIRSNFEDFYGKLSSCTYYLKTSSKSSWKICELKFSRFKISLITFTARMLGNAILARRLFTRHTSGQYFWAFSRASALNASVASIIFLIIFDKKWGDISNATFFECNTLFTYFFKFFTLIVKSELLSWNYVLV